MARVSTYLNFDGNAEQAFAFYRQVFGGDYLGPVRRFSDLPKSPAQPALSPEDQTLIAHITLPILGGYLLRGTDAPQSMGFNVKHGNGTYIALEPDTRADAERFFGGLSEGASIEVDLQDMPWGAYFGSLRDKFGVLWTVTVESTGPAL